MGQFDLTEKNKTGIYSNQRFYFWSLENTFIQGVSWIVVVNIEVGDLLSDSMTNSSASKVSLSFAV